METTPLAQREPLAAFSVLQIGRRRDYDFPFSKGELEIFGSRPECEVCEDRVKMRTAGGQGTVQSPIGAVVASFKR